VQQAWLKRQQARRRRAARRLERDRAWQLWMSQPLAVRVEKVSKWCNEVRAELGIEPVPLPPGEAQP
jgi:hypothetical protein